MYSLQITPGAERDIDKLRRRMSQQDFEHLRRDMRSLAEEPRPNGVLKMKGSKNGYRIRIGAYRILYEIYDDAKIVTISHVLRRTETTYRA